MGNILLQKMNPALARLILIRISHLMSIFSKVRPTATPVCKTLRNAKVCRGNALHNLKKLPTYYNRRSKLLLMVADIT